MNKNTLAFGIMILFLATSLAPLTQSISIRETYYRIPSKDILYVGGSGEGNYTMIQDAIDNASNGDTIFVFNGTYIENIIVDKSVNLIGESKEKTIIRGYWYEDSVVNITADWVNISGFKISSGDYSGIKICSDHNTIANNNILDELLTGIEICSNFNNIIDNNISRYWIYGIYLSNNAFGNYIQGNNITGEYYYDEMYGIVISDNCNNNTISENIISKNLIDIYIHSSYNITISKNIISWDTYYGMIVESSDNNIFVNNHFLNNYHGLEFDKSNNNTVAGNTFSDTRCCTCLSIRYSSNNKIDNNVIENDAIGGIDIYNNCYNNKITSNHLTSKWGNIRISISCSYNKIINNTISCDRDYNIMIEGSCSNNSIYHNNFINNDTKKAYDEGNNSWDDDYPSGGNYWDDYTGEDTDGDGIGDIPYLIPGGNNSDRYPLMEPWSGNHPPITPVIEGKRRFKEGEGGTYPYTICSIDPDGDDIIYLINWSDGTTDWMGPFESGKNFTRDVSIPKDEGTYFIFKVKAIDIYGAESNWATLEVIVPRNKATIYHWLNLFLDRFPFLELLFYRIKS